MDVDAALRRVAALALALALPGPAAPARAASASVSHVVDVTNHRGSPVVALGFGRPDDSQEPPNMLKHPIAPGASAKITVKAPPDACSFTVLGRFEDGTEIAGAGLDLCRDHRLVLVD